MNAAGTVRCAAAALIMALAGGLACSEARPSIGFLPEDGAELPILREKTGTHSHETRPVQIVIRDQAVHSQFPLADVEVDFEKEMILLVQLGRVPSDKYAVRIERVWREGRTLRVKTLVQRPPEGAPLAVASPWCLAVVPRCDLRVEGFVTEPPKQERSWGQSEPKI